MIIKSADYLRAKDFSSSYKTLIQEKEKFNSCGVFSCYLAFSYNSFRPNLKVPISQEELLLLDQDGELRAVQCIAVLKKYDPSIIILNTSDPIIKGLLAGPGLEVLVSKMNLISQSAEENIRKDLGSSNSGSMASPQTHQFSGYSLNLPDLQTIARRRKQKSGTTVALLSLGSVALATGIVLAVLNGRIYNGENTCTEGGLTNRPCAFDFKPGYISSFVVGAGMITSGIIIKYKWYIW